MVVVAKLQPGMAVFAEGCKHKLALRTDSNSRLIDQYVIEAGETRNSSISAPILTFPAANLNPKTEGISSSL